MAERELRGLLVDFGGVLTTNIWASFDRFCELENLERGTVLEPVSYTHLTLPTTERV